MFERNFSLTFFAKDVHTALIKRGALEDSDAWVQDNIEQHLELRVAVFRKERKYVAQLYKHLKDGWMTWVWRSVGEEKGTVTNDDLEGKEGYHVVALMYERIGAHREDPSPHKKSRKMFI